MDVNQIKNKRFTIQIFNCFLLICFIIIIEQIYVQYISVIKKLFVLLLTTNNYFLILPIDNSKKILKNLSEIEMKIYRFSYCYLLCKKNIFFKYKNGILQIHQLLFNFSFYFLLFRYYNLNIQMPIIIMIEDNFLKKIRKIAKNNGYVYFSATII